MTEQDYIDALEGLINPVLQSKPKKGTQTHTIKEHEQKPFELNAEGLSWHHTLKYDALSEQWPCFADSHQFAHKRCDRIVISWDKKKSSPKFLLVELKSGNPNAHKQLAASLAFCHFLHRMVSVGQIAPPLPLFAAITVWDFPVALKAKSQPKLPEWSSQPLQNDCKHMHYPRSRGALPIKAVLAAV